MGETIIVSSGKGGVGKTNVAVNLGIALAELGKKIVIVDASLTTPDISLHFGIPFQVKSLSHVLKDRAAMKEAMFKHASGAHIIPGNVHVDILKEFEGNRFSSALQKLKKEHDIVLVDCGAGLGREAISAIRHGDKVLAVATPELSAVVNAAKALQIAKSLSVEPLGVILNRVGRHKHELKEKEMLPLLENVPILAAIPEDEKVAAALRRSEAVVSCFPKSRAGRAFKQLALQWFGKKKVSSGKKAQAVIRREPKKAAKMSKANSRKKSKGKRKMIASERKEQEEAWDVQRMIPKFRDSKSVVEGLKEMHAK